MRFVPDKMCLTNLIVIPKRQIGDYRVLTRLVNKMSKMHPGLIFYAFISTKLPVSSFLLLTNLTDLTLFNTLVAYTYKTKATLKELLDEYWVYSPSKRLSSCLYPDDILCVKCAETPLFDNLEKK